MNPLLETRLLRQGLGGQRRQLHQRRARSANFLRDARRTLATKCSTISKNGEGVRITNESDKGIPRCFSGARSSALFSYESLSFILHMSPREEVYRSSTPVPFQSRFQETEHKARPQKTLAGIDFRRRGIGGHQPYPRRRAGHKSYPAEQRAALMPRQEGTKSSSDMKQNVKKTSCRARQLRANNENCYGGGGVH